MILENDVILERSAIREVIRQITLFSIFSGMTGYCILVTHQCATGTDCKIFQQGKIAGSQV